MTVLDNIKSFFKRAKPVAKVTEEKPLEVAEGKLPEAAREKPTKTIEPQKKARKATRSKTPRARKRKKAT